jgi:hypothetical protein
MASLMFKGLVGVIAGTSLFVSSTAAVAAVNSAPVQQVNPWAALAVMSGSAPAAVLCGSSAAVAAAASAAAQAGPGCVLPVIDTPVAAAPPVSEPPAPIPVPPVETVGGGFGVSPLLLALAAVAAGVGIYLLVRKHENSPA